MILDQLHLPNISSFSPSEQFILRRKHYAVRIRIVQILQKWFSINSKELKKDILVKQVISKFFKTAAMITTNECFFFISTLCNSYLSYVSPFPLSPFPFPLPTPFPLPHSYPVSLPPYPSLPPFSSSPPFPHPLSSLPLPSLFHPIALPIPSSPHLPSILSLPSSLHPSHPSHSSDIALSIQKPAGSIQRLKEGVENFSLGTNTWTNDIIFKPNCTYISLPFLPSLSHLHLTKITLYDEKQFQK